MSSSISDTFNGVVRKEPLIPGLRGTRFAYLLDCGDQKIILHLGNMNPFTTQPLDAYVGAHVTVTGIAYNGKLFIGSESNIVRRSPPAR